MITTKELVTWKSSANKSGIIQSIDSTEYDDLIKTTQKSIFFNMYTKVKDKPIANLVKIWSKECTNQCNILRKALISKNPNKDKNDIEKVVHKVRGNSGEIFAEKMVIDGYLNYLDVNRNTYECVNGFNENKEDISATSIINPKVHIGIQVKNNAYNPISTDVLMNAGYMDGYWIRQIPIEDIEDYKRFSRQIIISFTDMDNLKFFNDPVNVSMIKFIGPRDINRLLGDCPIGFFKEIAEDI